MSEPIEETIEASRPAIAYLAGYRDCRWRDRDWRRPVWAEVWYPASVSVAEGPVAYGLGEGRVARDAPLASGARFPLVVLSPGAAGSGSNYAWLAEHLARAGFVVVGVSHFGESWRYGPATVEPGAAARLWLRPPDCSFAIDRVLEDEMFGRGIDRDRIAALGHSSGGTTALALGGAVLDPDALRAYCRSELAVDDRGCQYGRPPADSGGRAPDASSGPGAKGSESSTSDARPRPYPPEARTSHRDARVKAVVMLDPAAGPGFSPTSLGAVDVPVLVVGCTDNDFLPFAQHAGRYAALLPRASLIRLDAGEGHFIFLNPCTSDLAANGVRLCADRPGVDRRAVQARLAPGIRDFLLTTLWT